MSAFSKRFTKAASLVVYVGATLFIVQATSGCEDKTKADDCCALSEDGTKVDDMPAQAAPIKGAEKMPANVSATGAAANGAVKASPTAAAPSAKTAPLPVFELKRNGLGRPQNARRPMLNIRPQQPASPTR